MTRLLLDAEHLQTIRLHEEKTYLWPRQRKTVTFYGHLTVGTLHCRHISCLIYQFQCAVETVHASEREKERPWVSAVIHPPSTLPVSCLSPWYLTPHFLFHSTTSPSLLVTWQQEAAAWAVPHSHCSLPSMSAALSPFSRLLFFRFLCLCPLLLFFHVFCTVRMSLWFCCALPWPASEKPSAGPCQTLNHTKTFHGWTFHMYQSQEQNTSKHRQTLINTTPKTQPHPKQQAALISYFVKPVHHPFYFWTNAAYLDFHECLAAPYSMK